MYKKSTKLNIKQLGHLTGTIFVIGVLLLVNQVQAYTPPLDISVSVEARNITRGGSWSKSVFANSNDTLEFYIKIKSINSETAENVYVRDYLPSQLTYISGSASGATTQNITSGDFSIGDISAGSSKIIYFKAEVVNEDEFRVGSTTLNNRVKAYPHLSWAAGDTNEIIINRGQVLGASTSNSSNSSGSNKAMKISKLVRNVSAGQIGFRESISAQTGELIEFSILITNTGDRVNKNVKVWDVLPAGLDYVDGTCYLGNKKVGDGIAGAGLLIDKISIGQSETIKFKAKISSADKFDADTESLTNYIYANADGISDISDTASINITVINQQNQEQNQESEGQVLGATDVQTGPTKNLALPFIASFLISVAIFWIIRNEKVIQLYNRLKLRLVTVKLKVWERNL